ncbi:MAG: uracil phosphoribosyltransferase [Bdellovibrionales bacterium]|nr:uracil phosphoribosyltransferase [Bdellovibrionales bacterium]
MVKDLCLEASLLGPLIADIRNILTQNDRARFRENIELIGQYIGYEISKTLRYTNQEVTTPLGKAQCKTLAEQPVLATVLRAGLPLHAGLLRAFPKADNGVLSAYRKHTDETHFEICLQYASCPPLQDRVLILNDPMLATGKSIIAVLRELEAFGTPKEVHLVSVIAAQQGIDAVEEAFPQATIWTAAIDPDLNEKGYIVPGLGDAGDLAFGHGKHL